MAGIDFRSDRSAGADMTFDEFSRDDDFEIEVAFSTTSGALECVYTRGLSWFGRPELYVEPPPRFALPPSGVPEDLATFLAAALMELGEGLLESDDVDIPPYDCDFRGEEVTVWLHREERPEGALAIALPLGTNSVVRVECSLWHPAPTPADLS
jgi:hypothetical protein